MLVILRRISASQPPSPERDTCPDFLSKSHLCFIEARIVPNEAKRFDPNKIEKVPPDVDLAGDSPETSPEPSPDTLKHKKCSKEAKSQNICSTAVEHLQHLPRPHQRPRRRLAGDLTGDSLEPSPETLKHKKCSKEAEPQNIYSTVVEVLQHLPHLIGDLVGDSPETRKHKKYSKEA